MAFIHVRVTPDSKRKSAYYYLDGGEKREFDYGEYVEVSAGMHVLTFVNDETKWNVRATINDKQELDVVIIVGYDGIVCAPSYNINEFDEEDIEYVRGKIEYQRKEKEKFKKLGKEYTRESAGIYGILVGIALLIVSVVAPHMNFMPGLSDENAASAVITMVGILLAIAAIVLYV